MPPTPRQRFQSTLSMRRATGLLHAVWALSAISIHALHEESDVTHFAIVGADIISIHALHEESDRALGDLWRLVRHISIHALHEESDPDFGLIIGELLDFNPRSP